jgi:hypothetical protein
MKKLFIALTLFAITSCNQEQEEGQINTDTITNSASAEGKIKTDLPEIKFEEETFDFGRITQGEKVEHAFTFTNTGKSNLIVSGASGSCGCTVPEWPREPVKPGQGGKINVVFNSEGKSGLQEKTVTIVTNSEPATRVVRIKADVVVAETAR